MQLGSPEWFLPFQQPDHPQHPAAVRLAEADLDRRCPGLVRVLLEELARDYDPDYWAKRPKNKTVSPGEAFRRFVEKRALRFLRVQRKAQEPEARASTSTRRQGRTKSSDHRLAIRVRKVLKNIYGVRTQAELRAIAIGLLRRGGRWPDHDRIRAIVASEQRCRLAAEFFARVAVRARHADGRRAERDVARKAAMDFWGWKASEVARERQGHEPTVHSQCTRYRAEFAAVKLEKVVRLLRRFARLHRRRCI